MPKFTQDEPNRKERKVISMKNESSSTVVKLQYCQLFFLQKSFRGKLHLPIHIECSSCYKFEKYKHENLSQRSFLGHPVNVSTILPYTDHWHYFRMTKEKPGRRRKKEKPGHLRSRRLMSTMFTSRFRGISPTLGIGLGQGSNSFWWTLSRVPLSVMLVVEVESTWVLTLCCTVLERIDVEVSAS